MMQISLLRYSVTVLTGVLDAPFYKMENRLLSHQSSPGQQRYAVIEKEMLAICFAAKKFSTYILGKDDVTVETDYKPLEAIFKKSLLAAPIHL